MIKTLFTTAVAVTAMGAMVYDSYSKNDGIAGRTGSPSSQSCLPSCHTGNTINAAGGTLSIASPNMPNWNYTPGQTYTLEVTVARSTSSKFGFALEALKSNGASTGSFTHTNPNETWSKSANVAGNIRESAVHKTNGGLGTGSKTFTVNWTAPATNEGNITFYMAGNATNSSNTSSGDFIYTASQIAIPNTASIHDVPQLLTHVQVFPNPVSALLNVTTTTAEKTDLKIELFTIEGRFTELLFIGEKPAGKHPFTFDINGRYSAGLYLLKVTAGPKVSIKKVYIQ
ncbi:MAG: T9SS type A sorting domain-containing protein [Bacteroidia bacterium]|nr:T9SS type A sorting domain-containing protein [Bacteroidia bacterium]